MLSSFGSFCFVYYNKTSAFCFNIPNFAERKHKAEFALGGIAQLVEHLPCKQGVSGSIPLTSTIKFMGS